MRSPQISRWYVKAVAEFPDIELLFRWAPLPRPEQTTLLRRVRNCARVAHRTYLNSPEEIDQLGRWLQALQELGVAIDQRCDDEIQAGVLTPATMSLFNAHTIEHTRFMRWVHLRGLEERMQIANRRGI